MTKQLRLVCTALLAGALIACSSGDAAPVSTPGLTMHTVEPTPTATPVAAVTPSAIGFPAEREVSRVFPPPPLNPRSEPESTRGISRLIAPGLGVDGYIEAATIVNNEMQPPEDSSYAVGWYPEFGLPGAGGNVVMSAHETWDHMQGPFYGLHKAVLGDVVQVKMADGRTLEYQVISNHRYAVDDIPMGDIIWPDIRPQNEEWLTLMTCGGRLIYNDNGFGEYLDRDVVVARRVS